MPALSPASLAAPRETRRDLALAVLLGALSVGAWAALWAWSASPYARYAAHGGWADLAILAGLCRALPGGTVLVPAALYALAWVLMIAAMMLPTTYPVLGIFRVMTRGRADGSRLLALVLAGFFAAWFAFGVIAHALDGAVVWLGGRNLWLAEHGWLAGVAVLGSAGLFQFSALKYRCLDQCRTPFAFVTSRWRGRTPARDAFRIGVDHGIFCVGCCWALMLLLFVGGVMNLWTIAALTGFVLFEKLAPLGERSRMVSAAGLAAAALWLVLRPL